MYKKTYLYCTKIEKMKSLTISTLRKDIKEHFDYVSNNDEIIVVPRTNEDDAIVIMTIKEFNALKETEYLLSSTKNRKRLDDALDEMLDNKTISFDLD